MIIFRLLRLLINLTVSAILLFYVALYIPAPLLKHYGELYSNLYVTPYQANNFSEWTTATEVALAQAKQVNKWQDFLLLISFPGYHLDFARLDQQLRQENQTYGEVVSRLKAQLAADPGLQRQWEQRELGNLKGLHGTEPKPTAPLENMAQGILEKMDQVVDTVTTSANPTLAQFADSRKRAASIGEKLQTLNAHWEEEKQSVLHDSKQLLGGAWEAVQGLIKTATDKATTSDATIQPATQPAAEQPQAYH